MVEGTTSPVVPGHTAVQSYSNLRYAIYLISLMFRPSACQLSAVVPFRLQVLRSGTAYQTMSLPLRPCQPFGAI